MTIQPSPPSNTEAGPSRPHRSPIRPIDPDAASPYSDPFASLPKWDPAAYEPPTWASEGAFRPRPRASSANADDAGSRGPVSSLGADADAGIGTRYGAGHEQHADADADEDAEAEDWQDAMEELKLDEAVLAVTLTLDELKLLLDKALELKTEGNAHFTAKPPRESEAIAAYKRALDGLPVFDKPDFSSPSSAGAGAAASGPVSAVQELSDAEAAALEADLATPPERRAVEAHIIETRKACLGNLGACFLAQSKDKECVEVCTKALKIDPRYVKALQRRATANERIGRWAALESAQEDYRALVSLLPSSSPHLAPARRALASLPERITEAQQRDKDELVDMAKKAGNTVLGWFGMSMDNIKFEQQPGGGYGVKFES